jgi:hypothetical protein
MKICIDVGKNTKKSSVLLAVIYIFFKVWPRYSDPSRTQVEFPFQIRKLIEHPITVGDFMGNLH